MQRRAAAADRAAMAKENANIRDMMSNDDGSEEQNVGVHLQAFRVQWMADLRPSSGSGGTSDKALRAKGPKRTPEVTKEERATELFMRAVHEEQNGSFYEAIKFYRMAMQLVPDIEFKVNYSHPSDADADGGKYSLMDSGSDEVDDLHAYLEQKLTLESAFPKICNPELDLTRVHISALPSEILMYIFRWVISSDLDMRALEQLSLVCRGFYICAREPELWHSACVRVWGRNCTNFVPFKSWRDMFLRRPRVRFDGVYISKTSYMREGEKSLDGFYRAVHQVEYYRYLRFFPDGQVIMLTTPEVPLAVVHRLRSMNTRFESALFGHYRLSQETDDQTKVFAVVGKKKDEKQAEIQSNPFCRRNPQPESERTFHVGFHLPTGGRNSFNKLVWLHHSCHITYRLTGETVVTAFDLDSMYTPFHFARVKSYTASSKQPL